MKIPLSVLVLSTAILSISAQGQQNIELKKQPSLSDEIEVITVTSQRVSRPIVEVASNLTLIDSTTIEDLHLTDLSALMTIVPNVSMQSLMGDYDYIQMRGMPRNLEQATVGVYIDGVPYSSLYGLNLNLLNIESVEVLRGPQGNLFGKNTRDGVIAINTKKNHNEIDAYFTGGIANFNKTLLETKISAPLIEDALAFSFAGKILKRDGVVENSYLDDQVDDLDEKMARLTLDWLISDNFTASITANYLKKENGSYPYVDGSVDLASGDKLATSLDTKNKLDQDINNLSLLLNWQLTNIWSIDSISSWDQTDTFGRFDADLTNQPFGHYDTWIKEEELYQELRLSSLANHGYLDYLFGLSFNKNEDNNNNEWLVGFNSIEGTITKDALVAYADITWRLPQDWQLQSGVRWLDEKIVIDSVFNNPFVPLPSAQTSGSTEQTDSQWLGKLALSKKLSQYQNVYVSWGQGYLSGGASWIAETSDLHAIRQGYGVVYQPEKSNAIELGYKAQLFSQRSTFDIAIFDANIKDYQHASIDAMGVSRIKSIKEVDSQGIEASLNTKLNQAFDWLISIGYNDAKVAQVDGYSGATTTAKIEPGERIPYSPKYNFHTHLNYHTELSSNWLLNTNISWQRFGSTNFDFSGSNQQDDYNTFAANLTLNYGDHWQLKLWGKNITDERYKIYQINFAATKLASYGMPRQIGLDVSWSY